MWELGRSPKSICNALDLYFKWNSSEVMKKIVQNDENGLVIWGGEEGIQSCLESMGMRSGTLPLHTNNIILMMPYKRSHTGQKYEQYKGWKVSKDGKQSTAGKWVEILYSIGWEGFVSVLYWDTGCQQFHLARWVIRTSGWQGRNAKQTSCWSYFQPD